MAALFALRVSMVHYINPAEPQTSDVMNFCLLQIALAVMEKAGQFIRRRTPDHLRETFYSRH